MRTASKITQFIAAVALFALGSYISAHAQTKISALPDATTLAGTEVAPVVQGGATVKATAGAIGYSAMVLTPTGNCLDPNSVATTVALVLLNDGVAPNAFTCTPANHSILAWDLSNRGLILPVSSHLIAGASAGANALTICIAGTNVAFGPCSNYLQFTGGGSGDVIIDVSTQTTWPFTAAGSPPSVGGTCGATINHGGGQAGELVSGATSGSCTVTLAGANGADPVNGNWGYICTVVDETTPTNLFHQTGHSGASCTVTGAQTTADVLLFTIQAY